MTETRLLIRHYMKGQGGIGALYGMKSVKTKWGKVGMVLLTLYLALVFGWFMFASALSQALIAGNRFIVTVLFYTLIQPFIFMAPIAIGLFQEGKDIDMLLSWPVERRSIFASRLSVLSFWMLPMSLIVYVPMIVLSVMLFGFAPLWILCYTVMHLSAVFCCGMLLAFLSVMFSKNVIQWITSLVSILFMVVLFRTGTAQLDMRFDGGVPALSVPTPSVVLPLVITAVCLITGALLWPVCTARFGLNVRGGRRKDRRRKAVQKTGTPIGALMKSEFMQIRSDPSLMTEFIMELIMPIFLIVIYMVMGIAGDLFMMMQEVPEHVRLLLPTVIVGGTCTLNMLSATTFSREGRMKEIYSALPITKRDRMLSKLFVHILAELPAMVVCLAVFSVLFRVPVVNSVMGFLWCTAVTVLSSVVGLNMDIRNPYTGWEKRVDALKKNFNGMKSGVLTLVLGALSIAPWMILKMDPMLSVSIALAITVLFAVLFSMLLRKAADKI